MESLSLHRLPGTLFQSYCHHLPKSNPTWPSVVWALLRECLTVTTPPTPQSQEFISHHPTSFPYLIILEFDRPLETPAKQFKLETSVC